MRHALLGATDEQPRTRTDVQDISLSKLSPLAPGLPHSHG